MITYTSLGRYSKFPNEILWCAIQADLMSLRVLALPWCIKLQEHKTSVAVWSQRSSFWRNFTKGVPSSYQDKEEAGRVVSVNPTPPLPPSLHGDARWGIRWRHNHTDTHTRADSLSTSPSLAFLFWEATLGITPSAPPEPVAKPQPKRTNSLSSLPEAKKHNIVLQHLASAAF